MTRSSTRPPVHLSTRPPAVVLAILSPLLEKNPLKTFMLDVPVVFSMSRLIVLAFAVALYRSSSRTRLFKVGLGLLVLNAFAGVMMVTWFREDPGRVVTTASGAGHIVFATVSSLTIVVGSIVYGFAFRRSPLWRGLSAFSFAVGAAMIAFSPIAIAAINSPLAGLAERGAIGVFLVWLIGVGGYLLNHSPGRRTVVA